MHIHIPSQKKANQKVPAFSFQQGFQMGPPEILTLWAFLKQAVKQYRIIARNVRKISFNQLSNDIIPIPANWHISLTKVFSIFV